MPQVYTIGRRRRDLLRGMSVNSSLILANVITFIVFIILLSRGEQYINFIALKPLNIFNGQYLWTFLTSMFMHGGVFHLFANMLSMFFVGSLVEKILGPKRYFWFYMVAGLFAGVFFVLMSLILVNEFNVFAVGASGALFGLIGLLMILTPNLPVYIMFIPIPVKMKYAAPGILIVLWLISIAGNVPIGNTAHLGGLIVGLAYGFYLRRKYPRKTRYLNKHFS